MEENIQFSLTEIGDAPKALRKRTKKAIGCDVRFLV